MLDDCLALKGSCEPPSWTQCSQSKGGQGLDPPQESHTHTHTISLSRFLSRFHTCLFSSVNTMTLYFRSIKYTCLQMKESVYARVCVCLRVRVCLRVCVLGYGQCLYNLFTVWGLFWLNLLTLSAKFLDTDRLPCWSRSLILYVKWC